MMNTPEVQRPFDAFEDAEFTVFLLPFKLSHILNDLSHLGVLKQDFAVQTSISINIFVTHQLSIY